MDVETRKQFAMKLSLSASLLMLVGKLTAYFVTGSSAILSDAIESVVHIVATMVAAFGLWYARRPADADHPYGHGKVVLFSIGLEGFLISLAAVIILYQVGKALIVGPELSDLGLGLFITGSLGTVNLFLGRYLIKVGKECNAPALIANGYHILSDMWTSYAVVLGVTVVWLTDVVYLDPIVGFMAAMYIIYTGGYLMLNAVNQAMDRVQDLDSHEIQTVLESCIREKIFFGYHQLRHRRVNDRRWLEVHLLFPANMSVCDAHRRATEVETRLEQLFAPEPVTITSHLEPDNHAEVHPNGHPEEPLRPN